MTKADVTRETRQVGSDDIALYHIGGWAIYSAIAARAKNIQGNADIKKEIELLQALQLPQENKKLLSVALKALDRGGLIFPKELLPYLREVEARMIEILNAKSYQRYGDKIFEV